MNIYNAIMRAADHIERNQDYFDFGSCGIPPDCGTPGCAIGWVNFFSSTTSSVRVPHSRAFKPFDAGRPVINSEAALGVNSGVFYLRMSAIAAKWQNGASICAGTLRLYAEKYHGHEKPAPAPDWNVIASSPLIPEHVKSEELVS